jgi:hypothetical protein
MLDLALALALGTGPAQPPPPPASITARLAEEEGRPELIATVMAGGRPLANAGVSFRLTRSFGDLPLGEDTTLEDGTAAAPFPRTLGPDAGGGWTVAVSLTSPEAYQGQERVVRLIQSSASAPPPRRPPRELWARRAPWSLLAAVSALMAAAWAAYGFAAYHLVLIQKGGRDA